MSAAADGFDAALADVADVDGWLSDDQARRLWQRARAVRGGGTIVEIGSYRGRSTIVLARACSDSVRLLAIDPHAGNDRGPQQIEGTAEEGDGDNRAFEANLARAGVRARVEHLRRPSQAALDEVDTGVDLLYVDGAHRYSPALADIDRWGACVNAGGTLLIHDAFSSVGVTLAILRRLAFADDFHYVGRSRSLAEYRRASARLGPRARLASTARQARELPWFLRNVAIKLALIARQPGLARRLGHRAGDEWPY